MYCSKPKRLVNSGTGNASTSYLVSKTRSCDGNSFKRNKQTTSSEVSMKTVSFMNQSSILVALIIDRRPFFCGWGRDFSLSLEKGFKGAAGVILWWISFELGNSLDRTMPSCEEFYLLNTVHTIQYNTATFISTRWCLKRCRLCGRAFNLKPKE